MRTGCAKGEHCLSGDANCGFTLTELMIVLVIFAIVLSLAIPSYRTFIIKTRRADAIELIYEVAQRMQQYHTQNHVYHTNAADELGISATSKNGYYALTIAAGPTGSINTSYSLSAVPVEGASQTNDTACGTFLFNSLGEKSVSGSQTKPPCW